MKKKHQCSVCKCNCHPDDLFVLLNPLGEKINDVCDNCIIKLNISFQKTIKKLKGQ